MRTNVNVQELTVAALLEENPEHIYHAAMLDPHTAAELDLDQIWELTTELLAGARRLAARLGPAGAAQVGMTLPAPRRRPAETIVIVGGGTAGWLAALILGAPPEGEAPEVTVIESSKIGTIGVGEGTTAVFRQMLQHLRHRRGRVPRPRPAPR